MTRLERMVRDADAFLGLYPYPEAPEVRPTAAALRAQSAYFRLELDLAVRSGKPAIVFYDQRYRAVLPRVPYAVPYDPQELVGEGGWPTRQRMADVFTEFSSTVEAARTYQPRAPRERLRREAKVGLLLPTGQGPGAYTAEDLHALEECLEYLGLECVSLELPRVIGPEFLIEVWQLDWAVVDVGATGTDGAVLAYLHGQFLPMLRLRRVLQGGVPGRASALERILYGGFNVGYSEDNHTARSRLPGGRRCATLTPRSTARRPTLAPPRRPSATSLGPRSARRRSSSATAARTGPGWRRSPTPWSSVSRRSTTTGGDSIPVGSNWYDEIIRQVSTSPVGIPFLSASYLTKPYCLEEAERMASRHVEGKMTVLPVNLDDTTPPAVLDRIQYVRTAAFPDAASLVEHLIAQLPPDR